MPSARLPQILLIVSCTIFFSCQQRSKSMSFYYWRTQFFMDSSEQQVLRDNQVNKLYIRYFDIDFPKEDTAPAPVGILQWNQQPLTPEVIPVVYIKNRVFQKLNTAGIRALAAHTHDLISQISKAKQVVHNEVQFDCDWTDSTRIAFFHFIETYRGLSQQIISVTIRLHQVKYHDRTGVPPADRGVLMYYNMSDINPGNRNSIYDKIIADNYVKYLSAYPMQLDLALPIFAWGLQVRDGKVVKLLNKMNYLHFETDSNFQPLPNHRFLAKQSCFHGGYYFIAGDEIKTEHVEEKELMEMVDQVNKYSNGRIRDLIFYELDKENLSLYDKAIFGKILDRTR
ncbi:MAG: hypothetical protein KGO82_01130 [Bacteroidota bacterium]|nr:hypothetical protein [Bacteroidota bacterium]